MTRLLCILFGHDPAASRQHRMGERAFAEWHDDVRRRFGWPLGAGGCCRCGKQEGKRL